MKVAHRKCETCMHSERCRNVRAEYIALFNELDDKYKRTDQSFDTIRENFFEIRLGCAGYEDEEAIVS